MYDFEDGKWHDLAPMSQGRIGFASVVVEQNSFSRQHIVAIGGGPSRQDMIGFACVEMYSIELDNWRRLPPMTSGKRDFRATMFKDQMVTGPTYRGREVECFDFHKQDWFSMPKLPMVKAQNEREEVIKDIGVTNAFSRNPTRNFYGCQLIVASLGQSHWYERETATWHVADVPLKLPTDTMHVACLFLSL